MDQTARGKFHVDGPAFQTIFLAAAFPAFNFLHVLHVSELSLCLCSFKFLAEFEGTAVKVLVNLGAV